MLVSIITVCLNAAETIETTVRSVIGQTYTDIEYIVVDGGSTDGTVQILEKYRDFFSVFISEKDEGIYDAMNKGIELAHGEYIGIINADDWYEKETVACVVQTARTIEKDIGVICGQCRFVDGMADYLPRRKSMNHIWTEMPIAHPAAFIKRSVYGRLGKYDTRYKIAADYELIFRLYVNHVTFYFCDQVLANYRVGGISGTQKSALLMEDIDILGRYQKYCDDPDTVKRSIQRKKGVSLLYQTDKSMFCKMLDIEPGGKTGIYIWGCGYWGRELCRLLEKCGVIVEGFIDNNSSLWGEEAELHVIEAPDVLRKHQVKVIIAVQGDVQGIETQIRDLNQDAKTACLERIMEEMGRLDKGMET